MSEEVDKVDIKQEQDAIQNQSNDDTNEQKIQQEIDQQIIEKVQDGEKDIEKVEDKVEQKIEEKQIEIKQENIIEKDQQEPQVNEEKLQQTEEPKQNMDNLFLKADYNFSIEIKVGDPLEKGSGMSKYVVYSIKGKDCFGEFEIQRRFNEFYTIRDILLARWPGQYIPPIPEKQVSTNQETILERTRLLNIFCLKMAQIKHLYYCEEFYDIFLRSTNSDLNKQLSNIQKQNVTQFIEKYQNTFNIHDIKEISSEMINKMGSVQSFLRKSSTQLNKLLEQAKQLSLSRKNLKEQFFNFFGLGIQEYEKQILSECLPSNELIFQNAQITNELSDIAKQIRDPLFNNLDKIQDLISTEQRDIEAFLQAFQTRDSIMSAQQKVQQKLSEEQSDLYKTMQGKSTMKGAFSKLSLDEQKQKLELQLTETQKEVDQYKKFFQLVTDVLTSQTIDKFKRDKYETYKCILKDLSQCELLQIELQQTFWLKIQQIINKE